MKLAISQPNFALEPNISQRNLAMEHLAMDIARGISVEPFLGEAGEAASYSFRGHQTQQAQQASKSMEMYESEFLKASWPCQRNKPRKQPAANQLVNQAADQIWTKEFRKGRHPHHTAEIICCLSIVTKID